MYFMYVCILNVHLCETALQQVGCGGQSDGRLPDKCILHGGDAHHSIPHAHYLDEHQRVRADRRDRHQLIEEQLNTLLE